MRQARQIFLHYLKKSILVRLGLFFKPLSVDAMTFDFLGFFFVLDWLNVLVLLGFGMFGLFPLFLLGLGFP